MAHKSHRKHIKHVHQHEAAETEHHDEHGSVFAAASFLQLGRELVSTVKDRVLAAPRAVVNRVMRRPRALMERFSGMYSQHRAPAK